MATLTSLSPSQSTAGQTLTLNGTGLSGTTKVNFGSKSVTPGSVTATVVTAIIPSTCAGQYGVSVTAGTTTSNSLAFFYAATPVLSALNPGTGAAAPGSVTLLGSGFLNATAVTFGSLGAGTALTVTNDTQLTVTPPAHGTFTGSTDTANVTATTPGGTSALNGAATEFVYYAAPTVTGISPDTGPAGTSVTVTGTNLVDVSDATFTPTGGGTSVSASAFTGVSDTQLIVYVPAGLTAGDTYDLQVVTPGGTSAVNAGDVFTAE
jgi:IPT/TIG domain